MLVIRIAGIVGCLKRGEVYLLLQAPNDWLAVDL